MLILFSKLKDTPVMSLQTGGKLATTGEPIINPDNLQIVAYTLDIPQSKEADDWLLRIADIRELSKLGYIIDSADEFIRPSDVIKINEIYQLDLTVDGIKVVDESGANIGKVIDFTIDLASFTIQQLIVKRPLLKSFNDPELTIHRDQITAIDNHKITIKNEHQVKRTAGKVKIDETSDFMPNYVNPFRN